MTGGLYNPMVLPALRDAGYSVTFDEVRGGEPVSQPVPDARASLLFEAGSVRLLGGALDLGGIIKGWTVDLGIDLMRRRSPNVFLNAGGDLRCEGREEGAEGWLVSILGPAGGDAGEGDMRGALATSTTLKRRWKTDSGAFAHHLIDPRTGLPAASPNVQASVWAPETWRAESWAKAVLIGGPEAQSACQAAGLRVLAVPG